MNDKPLVCEFCGRESTAENPVAYETWYHDLTGLPVAVTCCINAVGCEEWVGEHGNDEQAERWHYA